MFCKDVNTKKRGEMTVFLKKHFRYHTMNSWNRSTSYANNIKLHNLDKPQDIDSMVWWEMLEITDWQEKLSDLLEDFGRSHDWLWQAGINGRSGGYVVLYQGGINPSSYKSYCTHCGQKNYQAVPDGQKAVCGRCNAKEMIDFKQTHMQIFTWPGKSVDMGEDFRNWPLDQLQERVGLVQQFDQLCDDIVSAYIHACRVYRIVEEEILVPKTIKTLQFIGR